jgi:hypothetical protein
MEFGQMRFLALVLCLPSVLHAQNAGFGPGVGQQVVPLGSVDIYASPPSRLLGNAFNSPVASASSQGAYVVKDRQLIPSAGGTQLWLQIAPAPGVAAPAPCDDCWSYFGTEGGTGGIDAAGNFAVQTQ